MILPLVGGLKIASSAVPGHDAATAPLGSTSAAYARAAVPMSPIQVINLALLGRSKGCRLRSQGAQMPTPNATPFDPVTPNFRDVTAERIGTVFAIIGATAAQGTAAVSLADADVV